MHIIVIFILKRSFGGKNDVLAKWERWRKTAKESISIGSRFHLLNALSSKIESKKKTRSLRKEAEITHIYICLAFRLLCTIRIHCLVTFAKKRALISFCLQLHAIQCVSVSSRSSLSKSNKRRSIVWARVGVCVKPNPLCYIFMIILICVASKFSHKASI